MSLYNYHSGDLELYDNQRTNFELRLPHTGAIQKLIIKQTYGVLDGFVAAIYNSRSAAPPTESSQSSEETAGYDVELYRVTPDFSVAGAADTASDYTNSYPYRNMDGTRVLPERRLYLHIDPGGTGDGLKVFQVHLVINQTDY